MFFNFRDRQVINCHFGCWIINIFLGFTLSVFSKCAIANSLSSSDSGHSKVLRVAVTQCEDHLDYREIIANFLDVVKTSISADMQIDIRYLDINAIDKSVRNGSIDIFLANSAMFRTLTSAGVKDLATVITDRTPNPNEGDGATWIVRSERHDLQAPQDLAGRSVSAKAENSLAGWYFALGELIYDGINPDNFFHRTEFVGWNTDEVIENVLNGRTDAGVLPACYLEEYTAAHPQIRGKLKAIGLKSSGSLPCVVSTRLYPNWTVVITPSMPLDIAKRVSAGLLSESSGFHGIAWSVATRFDLVDNVFQVLRVGPYAYLREWSLKRFAQQYALVLILLVGGVLGLLFYSIGANRLIKVRTRQLSDAMRRQSAVKNQYEEAQRQLVILQRMGLLNQVSSILAHELRQPLGAILYYAHGLSRLIESGRSDQEKTLGIVNEMASKAQAANSIIANIRRFTKQGIALQPCDLREVVQKAVDGFLLSSGAAEAIMVYAPEPVPVAADPFEIELVTVNLLRNASEVLKSVANAKIHVRVFVQYHGDKQPMAVLEVEDNGPRLSPSALKLLDKPFSSQKDEGTGVGLSIVRDVADTHHGHVYFKAGSSGGLRVIFVIPLQE